MSAMCLMVLSIDCCVTPPEEKLRSCDGAVMPHEWVAVSSLLRTLPRVTAKYLRSEPNVAEYLLDVRAEMVLCAPIGLLVAPPQPQPSTSTHPPSRRS